jgi:hypothetical protein
MQVDHLRDHSERDLLGRVVVAVADSTWAPAGDFITEDLIFAVGAMTWNRFYVNSARSVGGGAPAARVAGQPVYIPPEKYYFKSIDTALGPAAVAYDNDMDINGLPFGSDLCTTYREALTNSSNPAVRLFGQNAVNPYPQAQVSHINYRGGAAAAGVGAIAGILGPCWHKCHRVCQGEPRGSEAA